MSTNKPAGFEPYSDIRKIDMGLSFGIIATEASDIATAKATNNLPSSQPEQTHDRIEINSAKYTTLEHNMFALDGSITLYPKNLNNIQTGWVSSMMSDFDNRFHNEKLEITLSKPQSSYGITIIFDQQNCEEYPKRINVRFYKNDNLLLRQDVTPKDCYAWVKAPKGTYSKIIIEFKESKIPRRRARITEVVFGIVVKYDTETIVSASERQSINLLSESLASKEFTITIDNKEKLYNLINPDGVYEYLQSGQYVNYWIKINDVMVNMGVRYYKSASSSDAGLTATIIFTDRLIFLDDIKYDKGQSGTCPLKTAIKDILKTANINTEPLFHGDIGNTIIRRCIPRNTTCREAIRLCTQAAMCICYIDRNDRLYFFKPNFTAPSHDINRNTMYSEPTVDVLDKFNATTVSRRDEYASNQEEEKVSKSLASEGELVREKIINNPLINDLNVFADWVLYWVQKRTAFNLQYRGDPILEVGDMAKVYDSFNVNGNALIEAQELTFNGGLSGTITARRL